MSQFTVLNLLTVSLNKTTIRKVIWWHKSSGSLKKRSVSSLFSATHNSFEIRYLRGPRFWVHVLTEKMIYRFSFSHSVFLHAPNGMASGNWNRNDRLPGRRPATNHQSNWTNPFFLIKPSSVYLYITFYSNIVSSETSNNTTSLPTLVPFISCCSCTNL